MPYDIALNRLLDIRKASTMRDWIFAMRGFSAALRLGTVRAAAEELSISQPALSRVISNLEDHLGFDLFRRERQRIVPTHEGLQFFREAQRILNVYDQLPDVARRIRIRSQRSLRIVCLPRLAQSLVAPAVAAFQRSWPGTLVTIDVQARRSIESWVVAGEFDFALTSFPIEHRTLLGRELFRVQPVVVAETSHVLASRGTPLKVADLAGEPIITLLDGTLLRRVVDEAFRKAGIEPSNRIDVSDAVMAAAIAGHGGGIVITDPISGGMSNTTSRIALKDLPPLRFGMVWPEGRDLTQEAQALLNCVLEEARAWSGDDRNAAFRIAEPPFR